MPDAFLIGYAVVNKKYDINKEIEKVNA